MIGIVSSFALGFTLMKVGLPWWSLLIVLLMLTIADTIVRKYPIDRTDTDFDR